MIIFKINIKSILILLILLSSFFYTSNTTSASSIFWFWTSNVANLVDNDDLWKSVNALFTGLEENDFPVGEDWLKTFFDSWVIESYSFWDFSMSVDIENFWSWWLKLYEADDVTYCTNSTGDFEHKEYYFSWTIKSDLWWEIDLVDEYLKTWSGFSDIEDAGKDNWISEWVNLFHGITTNYYSYFCPNNKVFRISFYSDHLWLKTIGHMKDEDKLNYIDNDNPYENKNFSIFNKTEIAVSWLINKNIDLSNIWEDVNVEDQNKVLRQVWVNWSMMNINSSISKNIELLTRWITAENNKDTWDLASNISEITWNSELLRNKIIDDIDSESLWKKLYYFDYTQEYLNSNKWTNYGLNEWKILQIWESDFDETDITDYQIWVKWENTIIVKWGNIYINADIYNYDKNSILTIVVKRDKNNLLRWWNIYINPNVTNIDAILIADWSILSFSGIDVIDPSNKDLLRKQLLIYWSISSKNTIWDDTAKYWTDHHYYSWEDTINSLYNLANLRSFELVYWENLVDPGLSDCEITYEDPIDINWEVDYITYSNLVPKNGSDVETYAWAWKRLCTYENDSQNANNESWKLRTTNRQNPLVVEYNPNIQIIRPLLLRR